MATLKERSDNWNANGIIIRDHRHDKGDGYEDTRHKSKRGKKPVPKKKGCPGNDGNQHVWMWISSRWSPNIDGSQTDHLFSRIFYDEQQYGIYHSYERHKEYLETHEREYCVGCYIPRKGRWARRIY